MLRTKLDSGSAERNRRNQWDGNGAYDRTSDAIALDKIERIIFFRPVKGAMQQTAQSTALSKRYD